MELLVDVLLDSVKDTAQLIPFLFVTYLAMEALEHSAEARMRQAVERAGAAGPVVGSLLGAVPQCGFSAMAATLFSGRVITLGTLVAVILSTSDEMLPVFIAHHAPVAQMLAIVLAKAAVGLAAGIVVDLVARALGKGGDGQMHIHELCEREHCGCDDEDDEDDSDANDDADDTPDHDAPAADHDHATAGHAHHHHHHHGLAGIARSALRHTVQVTAFIFAITLVFGLVIELVGHENLVALLSAHPVRSTFAAALVGLIPNCGASVAIASLYMEGVLSSGPMLSGLLASGGVGLLVLFRTNADLGQNLAITAIVYVVSVLVGLAALSFGIIF